jgi:hypothetical protein
MQVVGFFGVLGLVALMWLSGFQIVPDSATSLASASGSIVPTTSDTSSQFVGIQLDPSPMVSLSTKQSVSAERSVSIQATQNIEANSALLRGTIVSGQTALAETFFIYGYDQQDIERSIGTAKSYEAVVEQLRSGVNVYRVARSVSDTKVFETRVRNLASDTRYMVRLCAEAISHLVCSKSTTFETIPSALRSGDVRIPTIRINDEVPLDADSFSIKTTVAMRDTVDGEVYLIYGESQQQVGDAIGRSYGSIREDDELLQKTRLTRDLRGTQILNKTIDDLESDTQYYYVVCVAYDGLRDGVTCSREQGYKTHDEDFADTPRIATDAAVVSATTARLAGSISMRDFNNGQAFFVYGTDHVSIAKIGGETTMIRIRQSQDRLQRVLLDSDVDRSDDFAVTVQDLLVDTSYSARLCMQYENQNENYRNVAFVHCGSVVEFSTN